MVTFASNFFRVIADGERLILLRESGRERECWMLIDPVLTSWSVNVHVPHLELTPFGADYKEFVPGLPEFSADLSMIGGRAERVERPLIMGVDIFKRYTVTDYLDIINEKLKRR